MQYDIDHYDCLHMPNPGAHQRQDGTTKVGRLVIILTGTTKVPRLVMILKVFTALFMNKGMRGAHPRKGGA